MKIVPIDSTVLAVPTPKPIALEFRGHRLAVARVHTGEGLAGLGYSHAFGGGGAEAVQVCLETRLAPRLVGNLIAIPDRPGHRMALTPAAERKHRLR